ncbi:PAS domain S-box protein [bacterium]|nr:MAG: PAS domain S-box protein [bacterium]
MALLFPLNYRYIVLPMQQQIEEHRRTNQELTHTNEVLGRFFTIKDVFIAYFDANFNFIRVNETYANADGHDPSYYVGKNHFDLFPNEENQRIFENVVKTGQNYTVQEKPFEYAANPERGVSYWDWSLMAVKNQDGKVAGLIMVLNDVTERKKSQLAKAENERRFRAVFNQTFQHMLLLQPDGRVIQANQTALDLSGSQPGEFDGLPLWELPWWDDIEGETRALQNYIRLAAEGSIVRFEQTVRTLDAGQAILAITIKPLLDEDNHPILLIYEARDITFRIQTEAALIRNEEEIKRLYEGEKKAHEVAETLRGAALALSGSLNSGTVFDTLFDHLYKVIPYTSAHLELLEDEEHLYVRLTRGEDNWDEEKRLLGTQVEIKSIPIFEKLLKERQCVTWSDTATYQGSKYFPGKRYIGSWVAIPLSASEQVIGLCILEHVQPGFFTPEFVQLAAAITSQAAVAIQNAWLFEQVRDGREHLQALSRRLVEISEAERQNIARELHDEAGQSLASLMVGLRLLERDCNEPAAVVARSQELREMADSILENLHRLAVALRPASLDHLGLVPALRQHAETVSDQHGLTVQFGVVGDIVRLPNEVETAVYRIVQEALTNVVRHAQASRVDILLERRPEALVVIVEDNGVGFQPVLEPGPGFATEEHLGVLGMQERADMLNGKIVFERSSSGGTTVILEVPWQFES